jgi:exopolysaccharide/PEP-CTERM locus tyrosine autokinase
MGRIEDALAKLQARQPAVGDTQDTLGRVVPPEQMHAAAEAAAASGDDGPALHSYGGKHVEIDTKELLAQGLLAPETRSARLADEYRAIKRPLLRNACAPEDVRVPRGNLWLVSSAIAGEGKTFTCMNLCLSVAREKDWSVVLVDGDCKKPQLTGLFGAEGEPGLMDLLHDKSLDFDSVVMPTNIQGLSILPAGKGDEHASELLASSRMGALCDAISTQDPKRIVLFDSPPLLLTEEAPVLATQVGQILLVVQANRTPQHAVLEARDRLDPDKAINLLLNQADSRENSSVYGGYGQYGYGD